MNDPRIMQTMGVLLGIGLTVLDGDDASSIPSNAANSTMEALAKAKREAMARFEKAATDSMPQSNGTEEDMDTDDMTTKVEGDSGRLRVLLCIPRWVVFSLEIGCR